MGVCRGMVCGEAEMVREMRSVADGSMSILLLEFEAGTAMHSVFEARMVFLVVLSAL